MVESKLISDPNPHEPKLLDELIALQFYNEIKIDKCRNCAMPLPKKEIYHYRHPKGWVVPGYEEKQWLFIVCPKCNHQWSLWKLGFSRNPKIKTNIQKENPCNYNELLLRDKSALEKEVQLLMFDKVNLQSEIANLKLEKDKLTGK